MSTYSCLRFHLVFSTKERRRWICEDWESRLHAYMGGFFRRCDAIPIRIGGVEDHVHCLFSLKPSHVIPDLVRELKKTASRWVHETIGYKPFRWQDGYAIFSVSPSICERVAAYIANQRAHHRRQPFRDELRSMLDAAGVQYDPKYLE